MQREIAALYMRNPLLVFVACTLILALPVALIVRVIS